MTALTEPQRALARNLRSHFLALKIPILAETCDRLLAGEFLDPAAALEILVDAARERGEE